MSTSWSGDAVGAIRVRSDVVSDIASSHEPTTEIAWGLQLPVQSQSSAYVQPWEGAAGRDELAAVARAADQAGIGYVAVCDHVAIPAALTDAMGSVWFDTIATLGWLAGITHQARLLSHVFVAAYRQPAVTAKAFSTIDALSDGRAILGVGAGHVEDEFELLGVDFGERGALTSHAIDEIREIFRTGTVSGASVQPRALQPGGPPIWVGGSSPAAIRRAAVMGDGWLPQGIPEGGMRRAIAALAELRDAAGRDGDFAVGIHAGIFRPTGTGRSEHTISDHGAIVDRIRACIAVGGTQLQVRFESDSVDELVDAVGIFGGELWPQAVGS